MRELSIVREEIKVMRAQLRNLEISINYSIVSIEILRKIKERVCRIIV